MIPSQLVYDVGLHNGNDTAYYLYKGYRVVAVEADPTLVAQAGRRFRRQIADGRLILVNAAVSETEGRLPFWICESNSAWSSFDRSVAARNGSPHHEIHVDAWTFASILEQFGNPYFLKIDIEGNDYLCIRALVPEESPQYLSIEGSPKINENLAQLRDLGYTGFKLIGQRYFLPMQPDPTPEQVRYEKLMGFGRKLPRFAQVVRRWISEIWATLILRRDRRWIFPIGTSGSFGEATLGAWQSYDEIKATIDHFDRQRRRGEPSVFWKDNEYSYWVDLHARKGENG